MNSVIKFPKLLVALLLLSPLAYSQETATQVILHQNYSNPSNPATIINYQLREASHVSLKVYDVLGRVVTTLVDEWQGAGFHRAIFSTDNVSSGLYFYNLRVGEISATKKLVLLK